MAALVTSVGAAIPHSPDAYPAMFVEYVVRSAQTLHQRLATGAPLSREDLARHCDHALHVLTFALRPAEAWPAARDLLLTLAEPMEQNGARGDWLPFLERGVERSATLGDVTAEARLSLHIGHLHRLISDFTVAQQWLEASLHGFHTVGDSAGMARALNQLAYLDCLQHRYTQAVEHASAALALLTDDDHERATSYFVLGMVATSQWRWIEAETHHRAALLIRQRQGDARRTAWALQNVGYALQGQARFAEAIECLTAASAALDELGDQANAAIVRMNLARTYHLDGQLAEALSTSLAARRTLNEVGDRLHAARLATNLGLTYLALAEPRAALKTFQESVALFTALDNSAERINATSGVAMALLALEAYADAAAILAPAIDEVARLEEGAAQTALLRTMNENLAQARMLEGESNILTQRRREAEMRRESQEK